MTRLDDVRNLLQERAAEIVTSLYPNAKRDGSTYRLGNLQGDPGNSLSIEVLRDGRKGLWIDFATDEKGDIFHLIQAAYACDFKQALKWATEYLGLPPVVHHFPKPLTQAGKEVGIANIKSLAANQRKLQENGLALEYLQGERRGLKQFTIDHFKLGLSSYSDKDGNVIYKDALTYPQLDSDGHARARWLKSSIPGVTERPGSGEKQPKDWAAGRPSTHWLTSAEGKRSIFICEGAKDGWRIWQELQDHEFSKSLCIITSTHGSVIPEEWKHPDFWATWDKVFAGQDDDKAGDNMAQAVSEYTGKDVHRVRPPGNSKDWGEFFQCGGTIENFIELLHNGELVTQQISEPPTESTIPEDSGYYHVEPVDLSKSYVNGYLYYPFRALEVRSTDGQRQQRWRNLVLRSDGTICKAAYLPHLPDTPKEDRILALDDGTILTKMPVADPLWSTFKTDPIKRFAQCRQEGKTALTMPIDELVEVIDQHLRSKTVLPYEHDYAILSYTIITSYVQAIFEAVPLILIVGVAGSGKSELGAAMTQVSCNAVILNGQTSAASVARIIDSVGGLAVIDDLEGIGANTKNSGEFSDLVQQLKVSYKRATARKVWTNTQTMKVEELNFYGVKVINNTEGVDGILGTRMLKVYTRKFKAADLQEIHRPEAIDPARLREVQTNLHIWAMENAQEIAALYAEKYSRHSTRQEEITAPLRLLAEYIGHQPSSELLKRALESQQRAPEIIDSSLDLLTEAVKELIRQGYREYITMPQLELEMQRIAGGSVWGQQNSFEIAEWREPRWVGRQLRNALIVDPHGNEDRPRLWGQQIRLYPLSPDYVADVLNELMEENVGYSEESLRPLEFCEQVKCVECPYSEFCRLQERKQEHIRKRKNKPTAMN